MSKLELYSFLFSDCFFTKLIIIFKSPYVLDAMLIFGNYSKFPMLVLSAGGMFLACIINYLFGSIAHIIKIEQPHDSESKILSALRKFHFIIAALAWIPFFGKFCVALTGALSKNYKLNLSISFLSIIIYLYVRIYILQY